MIAAWPLVAMALLPAGIATPQDSREEWRTRVVAGVDAHAAGHLQEAQQIFVQALDLAEKLGRHPVERAAIHNRLASIALELGELLEAETRLREAGRLLAAHPNVLTRERANYLLQSSMLALMQVRSHDALKLAAKAVDATQEDPRSMPFEVAEAKQQLAVSLQAENRLHEARAELKAAEAICLRPGSACTATLAGGIYSALASIQWEEGELPGAAEALKLAVNLLEGANAPQILIRTLNNLGVLLLEMKEPHSAAHNIERALALCRKHLGDEHPLTGRVLMNHAVLLKKLGRGREARKEEAEARQVLSEWEVRNRVADVVSLADLKEDSTK